MAGIRQATGKGTRKTGTSTRKPRTPTTPAIDPTPAITAGNKESSGGNKSRSAGNKDIISKGRKILEKAPLFLAVAYQAYIVALYSYSELQKVTNVLPEWINYSNAIFSVAAGLSLDLVIVGTALRDDEKKLSHLLTILAAWLASSLIAAYYFPGDYYSKALHVSWTTMIMLFSLSSAEGKFGSLVKKYVRFDRNAKLQNP